MRAVHYYTGRSAILPHVRPNWLFSRIPRYHFCMAAQPEQPNILSFEAARALVEEHASRVRARGRELLSLLDSLGRVLAEAVHADRDFPPFPRATRDGYALRAADVETVPAELQIVGEIRAGGTSPVASVETGQAVAIMTGAPVPNGAGAVVMVEHTSRSGNRVHVNRRIASGDNIVPAGAEAKRGETLLSPGVRIGYAEIALASSLGRTRLLVHSKPKVAVLSTGDEVVDIDVSPGPNQIRNSNSYSLAAQVKTAGGDPLLLPIAPDEPKRLRELLLEGLDSDLLLITGGVSMGEYDLVEQVLAELKAEFFFTAAQIQPGKPVVFGRIRFGQERASNTESGGCKYFFGLPGNPISTMVTFELFAKPMLQALAGMMPQKLIFTYAKLKSEIRTKTGLKRFLPAVLSGELERSEVELVRWQGSGDIASVARSNCFLVVPPDRERIEAGEWVPVLLR
ncbi:MAG TPA: gephyrin-like molybdotransferase Glp [Terriglobales bacterium]|nr:gephyrin-like molybdotransferase Glp [Terriglobales bacterium]